jgi:hypothetical protein
MMRGRTGAAGAQGEQGERGPQGVPGRDLVTVRQLQSAAVAFVAMVLVFAGLLFWLEQRDIARRRADSIRACERVNILRADRNNFAMVLYVSTGLSAQREEVLAHGDSRPDVHAASARGLRAFQRQYLYRPYTDCVAAADRHGYQPPRARAFTKEQTAPLRALVARAGGK